MQTLTRAMFDLSPPEGLFESTAISRLFPDTSRGAREQLLHRALRANEVIRLTDGRYCLTERFCRSRPHPFVVAAFILYPTHVSFESSKTAGIRESLSNFSRALAPARV